MRFKFICCVRLAFVDKARIAMVIDLIVFCLNKVWLKFLYALLFNFFDCWDTPRQAKQHIGVFILFAYTMFNFVIVLCDLLNLPNDFTTDCLEFLSQSVCTVVNTHFKLITQIVASKLTQLLHEWQHFLANKHIYVQVLKTWD